ncbi:hypothetical protein HHI36_017444, partial [Cryptolaemus montrouzieri]
DEKLARTFYFSLAQTHLRYGQFCWGTAVNTYLNPLKIIQKRFLELLLNKNRRFPTDQLYEEAKVLDIRQMYDLNLAIDVIRRDGEELKKIDHNYQTRKNCPFLIPRTTSSKGHKSRSYMVARVFMESDIDIPRDLWTERLG